MYTIFFKEGSHNSTKHILIAYRQLCNLPINLYYLRYILTYYNNFY